MTDIDPGKAVSQRPKEDRHLKDKADRRRNADVIHNVHLGICSVRLYLFGYEGSYQLEIKESLHPFLSDDVDPLYLQQNSPEAGLGVPNYLLGMKLERTLRPRLQRRRVVDCKRIVRHDDRSWRLR